MRILIAEDDHFSKMYLYKFLSKFGNCTLAVDGIETVDAYILALEQTDPYDVIFLDVMMPKLDGLDVLKVIRGLEKKRCVDENSRVKIIMATAMNERNTILDCYEFGCDAFLAKPLLPERIVETFKELKLSP